MNHLCFKNHRHYSNVGWSCRERSAATGGAAADGGKNKNDEFHHYHCDLPQAVTIILYNPSIPWGLVPSF
jgi:hypothetical protein